MKWSSIIREAFTAAILLGWENMAAGNLESLYE